MIHPVDTREFFSFINCALSFVLATFLSDAVLTRKTNDRVFIA